MLRLQRYFFITYFKSGSKITEITLMLQYIITFIQSTYQHYINIYIGSYIKEKINVLITFLF